jgi:ABC-type transport system substrate-binding protein
MNQPRSGRGPEGLNGGFDRRTLLKSGAGLALLVGAGGLISACSTSSGTGIASTSASTSSTPKRGGILRIGASGGGTSDTLDPHAMTLTTDIAREYMVFNQLVKTSDTGESVLVLAESITPNADATQWTIKVKQGVLFHDGNPLTADDIIYNFKRILDNKFNAASALGPIVMSKSKVVDTHTVLLTFSEPYAVLVDNLAVYNFGVVPRNFDPKHPIGTGPFKFQSFTPGVESKFVRNENYWKAGYPYLDAIVLTDVADETGQMNGLQSQQYDFLRPRLKRFKALATRSSSRRAVDLSHSRCARMWRRSTMSGFDRRSGLWSTDRRCLRLSLAVSAFSGTTSRVRSTRVSIIIFPSVRRTLLKRRRCCSRPASRV